MNGKNEYVLVQDRFGRSLGATNKWQTVPDAFDYIIFQEGGKVYAKNGKTGEIEFSGDDLGQIINNIIQTLYSTIGRHVGHIKLSTGTFKFSTSIWLPYYYTKYSSVGIIIEGSGNATKLVYTGSSGYAFELNSDAVSDARTVTNHMIQNLVIQAPNTPDGAIHLKGATFNRFVNVRIENVPNGYGIYAEKNSQGSINLLNQLINLHVENNVKIPIYAIDNSQFIIDNSNLTVGDPYVIYFEGGLLWMRNTQVRATDTANGYSIYATNAEVLLEEVYNDGGNIHFGGGIVTVVASNVNRFSATNDTELRLFGARNIGNTYSSIPPHATIDGVLPPIIPAYWDFDTSQSSLGVQIVDDDDALFGKATTNSDPNNKGYVMFHRFGSRHILPRGRYLLLIRMKDTNQVTNDVRVGVWDYTHSLYPLTTEVTLSSDYHIYPFKFTINKDNVLGDLRIYVYKVTTNTNNIYVDFYRLIYLGTEVDDYTIGGGHNIILLNGVDQLPPAAEYLRGALAVTKGASGVADSLYVCLKDSSDNYNWVKIV